MSDEIVCQSKTQYTRREARAVVRHMSGRGRKAQAYVCKHCGKFHVTSSRNMWGHRNEIEVNAKAQR